MREEAGTCRVVGSVRSAMALQLKNVCFDVTSLRVWYYTGVPFQQYKMNIKTNNTSTVLFSYIYSEVN